MMFGVQKRESQRAYLLYVVVSTYLSYLPKKFFWTQCNRKPFSIHGAEQIELRYIDPVLVFPPRAYSCPLRPASETGSPYSTKI